ncbi:MAG: cytochrome c peroxidase [Chitinophagales bacterium]
MKSKITLFLILAAFLNIGFSAKYIAILEQQIDLPDTPFNYTDIEIPTHLSTNVLNGPGQNAATDNDNTPMDNPTTDEGATLGRVLFYDKNLSANQTVSCASCHKQANGFSDDAVLSIGFEGDTTRRHSMSLTNAKWYDKGRFFWDERAATLEAQVLMPFQDPVEMGMTLEEIVSAVESQAFYPALFEDAFGSEEVNTDRISKALAQFVRSMVSVSSAYDIGRAQVNIPAADFPNFTESENNGKTLFFLPKALGGLSCVGCHSTEAFINPDAGATNNGLDLESTDDLGVFEAIPNPAFLGTFKVPSLKNIELTAPYMHDGRFATLEEVVEHYNSGVQNHPNLNNSLKGTDGLPQQLNLTEQEKTDVVNFLKTLTDNVLISDVKFSDPFIADPCEEVITLNDVDIETETLIVAKHITADGTVSSSNNLVFEAKEAVVLTPGFSMTATIDAAFTAQINDCAAEEPIASASQKNSLNVQSDLERNTPNHLTLAIQPNPSVGDSKILFELPQDSQVSIHLFSQSGNLLSQLLSSKKLQAGKHELALEDGELYNGLFYVVLQTPLEQVTQKVIVVK